MFKIFFPNDLYSFGLDGSFSYGGKIHLRSESENDFLSLTIDGVVCQLARTWLALIAHYEVQMPLVDLSKIIFADCESKVIGLKCGKLMIFKSPISAGGNFFVIPGFTRFGINTLGVVKSNRSGRLLKPSIGPYGYPYVNLYDADKGRWRSVNLHVLLARTFIRNSEPGLKCFVNHIDGNKLNFKLNNLEWVTSAENQRHAIQSGLRKDNFPCKVFDTTSGFVKRYPSIAVALNEIGYRRKNVKLTRESSGKVIPNLFFGRYEIKRLEDESDWYFSNTNNLFKKAKSVGPFEAKNLASGEVYKSPTVKGLSEKIHVSQDSLLNVLRETDTMSVDGFLVRTESTTPWPTKWRERIFYQPRKVKVTNLEDQTTECFSSINSLVKKIGLDKRTLKNRLSSRKPYKNWVFEEVDF